MLLQPATKLGQGNVFTGVCDSVNGGVPGPGGVPGGDPPGRPLLRAVRILLECILVTKINTLLKKRMTVGKSVVWHVSVFLLQIVDKN